MFKGNNYVAATPLLRTRSGISIAALCAFTLSACQTSQPPTPEPLNLTGTSWVVDKISDDPVPQTVSVTMTFNADGRLAGSSGCNRYFASYTLSGNSMSVSEVGGTKRACPPSEMETESTFVDTLEDVIRWRQEGSDVVLATLLDDSAIRLTRAELQADASLF